MKNFIKIKDKNLFLLNVEILGVNEAQLWIGTNPDGPLDNDDQRVLAERQKVKDNPEQRISGIEAVDLKESQLSPDWFEVDTSGWISGIYRFNIHGKAGIETPNGTPLREIRDGEYSWPNFSDDFLLGLSDEQKQFLYLERNKAGFCMRIEILEDGEIKPAGDGLGWVAKWPELKKETQLHYEEKNN
ncbi:MAG: hypothetical protein RBS77_04980 [Candidatus Moranbacteria bacterium]|jgi:hypothetical protein|nr:hypothetical protein [Candidatus Moranbacteria bacterium]